MKKECYFTVEEANALIPLLEQRFGRILQMRGQLRNAYHMIEQHGETPSQKSLQRQDGPDELRSARGQFRALMETLREEVQAIDEAGVLIKDLDVGLCDFLGRRGGSDVYLCWQFGEKSVVFWHDLTTGFAGRHPIEEDEPPIIQHVPN